MMCCSRGVPARSLPRTGAFDDTLPWNDAVEEAFGEVVRKDKFGATIRWAILSFFGDNDMMAVRLIELHRLPKPTGRRYLPCDQTASVFLKVFLDAVFGA